jgi:hypothetical protein
MIDQRRSYLAYLLRLWQVAKEDGTGWRASLENAHTGRRRSFANLAELFSFLEEETRQIGQEQSMPSKGEKRSDIDT